MNALEYKIFHESHMKGNHGSNAVHTFFCIFFTVQCTILCSIQRTKYQWGQYLYEYAIIVLPLIIAHTSLAEYIYQLNVLVFVILLYNVVKMGINGKFIFYNSPKKRQSVTCLRGLTYLITSLAILGVDFKDFPRYLAKTESYGYSLMDTGVGLFVLMSGLVHKDFQKYNLKTILLSNMKIILILLVLGISRYVSIKQLDYHEHISEYGVHWNFFFTLAFCKIISTVILLFSNQTLLLSIVSIVLHETFLYMGLEEWVFSNSPRLTILDANREGISSNLGYVSLYLFAVHLKKMLAEQTKNILKKLTYYCLLFLIIAYCVNLLRPTSRTLANAGYCTYLIFVLLSIITVLTFIETSISKKNQFAFQSPLTLLAINKYGLFYFLICNLSTGLINIMFQTLLLPSTMTFLLLNVHMISTLLITILFYEKQ